MRNTVAIESFYFAKIEFSIANRQLNPTLVKTTVRLSLSKLDYAAIFTKRLRQAQPDTPKSGLSI